MCISASLACPLSLLLLPSASPSSSHPQPLWPMEQPIYPAPISFSHLRSSASDKPSAKVAPVMDKILEPVKEARVSPIKKEKVAEEAPLKTSKSDRKPKRNGTVHKKHEYTNGHDENGHTAVKIHLDKLKVRHCQCDVAISYPLYGIVSV